MKRVQLHTRPYAIFRSNRTAPGLYARQKWLQEASNPTVLDKYDQITAYLTASPLAQMDPAMLHNILCAFVVHPVYATHAATGLLVAWMADLQTPQGDWGVDIQFYQALNALAHLDTAAADRQYERALGYLLNHQNSDGSWGETDVQWYTFLAVHALRNKGLI